MLNFLKSGYDRVKSALSRTKGRLTERLSTLFGGAKIDEAQLEEIEEILYEADLGVKVSAEMTAALQKAYRKNPTLTPKALIDHLRGLLKELLQNSCKDLGSEPEGSEPLVILIVGVNGNGKTTSVAKIAKLLKEQGKSILVAASDTFRAAGMDQLQVWAERIGVDIVRGQPKSDPASVVFDALTAAKARGKEVVLVDTAGRLHTKTDLMQELDKIRRTAGKVVSKAPHETWLVLDATTGQNAVDQAKIFHQFTPLTGLVLTKLDGSAKGGIVFQIAQEVGIPLKFIGIGEGENDLIPFDPEAFTSALFD